MKKSNVTRLCALAIGAAMSISLVGCAGSNSEPAESPTAALALSDATIETFLAAGGGTAGAAEDGEVKVGWVNADSGPGSTPELSSQLEAAVELINTELGGVAGATLVVDSCEVTSEETGLSCAQKFANDDDIVAILQGSIPAGSSSFHSIIDPSDIPIVGALPLGVQDATAPNSFYTAAGSLSTVPVVLQLVDTILKPSSVALISVEGEPISTQVAAGLSAALGRTGVEVRQAAVELSAVDVTAPLIAAGVQDADLIIPLVILPPQCIAVDGAIKALGTQADVLALSPCQSVAVRDALGDYPEWMYLAANPNPDVVDSNPETQAQVDAYNEWYATLPEREMAAMIPLQTAITIQHLMNAATEPTREGISAAAKAWQGPIFLGSPVVAYGSITMPVPAPALPSLATRAYSYGGDGDWTDVTNGEWLGLPQ